LKVKETVEKVEKIDFEFGRREIFLSGRGRMINVGL